MPKKKETYVCSACGYVSSKWMGQCPQCGQWNTLEETAALPAAGAETARQAPGMVRPKGLKPLSRIRADQSQRLVTGIGEFDRVMGGGIVRDSLTIIAAKPGAGKSTLLLQVARVLEEQGLRILYISGEESESQIRRRAERILPGIGDHIWVHSTSSMNQLLGAAMDACAIALGVMMVSGVFRALKTGSDMAHQRQQDLLGTAVSQDLRISDPEKEE